MAISFLFYPLKTELTLLFKSLQRIERICCDLSKTRDLTKLEKQGVIQKFEYTHELAWNVLKDHLTDVGYSNLVGSKDSTRQAFKSNLISDGETWMEMRRVRNLTSHTYDEALAEETFGSIIKSFFPAFEKFTIKFTKLSKLENE